MKIGWRVRFYKPVYVKGKFYQVGTIVSPGYGLIRPAKIKVDDLDVMVSRYRNEIKDEKEMPWPNHGLPF
jgi:hypothetical protein